MDYCQDIDIHVMLVTLAGTLHWLAILSRSGKDRKQLSERRSVLREQFQKDEIPDIAVLALTNGLDDKPRSAENACFVEPFKYSFVRCSAPMRHTQGV